MKKYAILNVTFTQEYFIEMYDENISVVNGWTIEQIIEDWFKNYSMASYHATREGHEIGGSKKFVKVNVTKHIAK